MSLVRKQIRTVIKNALLNQTDADARVFTTRVTPVWVTELPVILVYDTEESVDIWAESPREYVRKISLSVQVLMEGEDDLDDDLDVVGQQVETVLYQDHTLDEICSDVILVGCNKTLDKDGSTLKGSLILNYQVLYHTYAAQDTSDLEWLNRVDAEYGIFEGAASADDPYDIITGIGD